MRGGGLAGLVTTTAVKSDSLSPEEARDLSARVEDAGVFDLPLKPAGEADRPDQISYSLTVEDEGRHRTVVLNDETLPEPVRSLIAWVDSSPAREESVGSPGRPPSAR